MKRTKRLQLDLQDTSSLSELISTFEEISAMRMRKVKRSVLSGREFLSGLSSAFGYISYSYRIYKKNLKHGSTPSLSFNTNGKSVAVLISSNTGLYGEIIKETFDLFMKNIRGATTDIVLVGKLGRASFEEALPTIPFQYFDAPDNSNSVNDLLAPIINYLSAYSNIVIYHGVFRSILRQEAQGTFVTGEVMKIEDNIKEKNISFLFEPSIEYIAAYFEKQVLSILLEQTLYESNLSKYASRMLSLDAASQNVDEKRITLSKYLRKMTHKEINSHVQTNIVGGKLWK